MEISITYFFKVKAVFAISIAHMATMTDKFDF